MKLARILVAAGAVLLMASAARSDSGMMSVQVKEGQLRAAPSFLSAIVGPVAYGDRVETLQQQGDWVNVKNRSSQSGWIHQSALTKKQVVLGAGGGSASSAASSQEIALAGKGFNADVERSYRGAHRNVDFSWVDRMENIRVSQESMNVFLAEGQVKPEGGVR